MTAHHHVAGGKAEKTNRKSSFKSTETGHDGGTCPSFYKAIRVFLIVGTLALALAALLLAAALGLPAVGLANAATSNAALKVVLVCRVSTKAQASEDKRSLEEQEAKQRRWAKEKGWQVVDVIVLKGASGAKEDAPQWQLIQQYLDSGQANAVSFTSVDRFARSALIGLRHLYKWTGDSHRVLIAGENVDTADPIMMFRIIIELACSQLKHGHNLRAGNWRNQRAREEGRWYKAPPLGYEVGDLSGKLQPTEMAAHVKQLFQDVLTAGTGWVRALSWPAGQALVSLEEYPIAQTPEERKRKPISPDTLLKKRIKQFLPILQNPAYAGLMDVEGELHVPSLAPGEEWAIITRAEFEAVQALLGDEFERKSALQAFTKACERVSWIRILERLFVDHRVTCQGCDKPIRFNGARGIKKFDTPVVTCDCKEEHRLFVLEDFEHVTAYRCLCGENRPVFDPTAQHGLYPSKTDDGFLLRCLRCKKVEVRTSEYPFPVTLPEAPTSLPATEAHAKPSSWKQTALNVGESPEPEAAEAAG